MTWRDKIKKVGIQKVARGMNISYTAAFKYTAHTFPDPGKRMKALVDVMFKNLPEHEFVDFLNSLSADVMGADCIGETSTGL